MAVNRELTFKQERFCFEYCKDYNGTQAAIRSGYYPDNAGVTACELLKKPHILERIETREEELAAVHCLSPGMVLRRYIDLATADPRELTRLAVRPCPLCWPDGLALEDPNPLCDPPRVTLEGGNLGGCGGAGVRLTILGDTSKLSRKGRVLFKGVKETRNGIEILMHDQEAAWAFLAKYQRMAPDTSELSGPNGGPVPLGAVDMKQLTDDQILARIAQLQGISGGTSQTIEGNPQELKALPDGSAPYVAVTGETTPGERASEP